MRFELGNLAMSQWELVAELVSGSKDEHEVAEAGAEVG